MLGFVVDGGFSYGLAVELSYGRLSLVWLSYGGYVASSFVGFRSVVAVELCSDRLSLGMCR